MPQLALHYYNENTITANEEEGFATQVKYSPLKICKKIGHKPEVLLVDDDRTFCSMLAEILTDCSVICAPDGAVGLDLFRRHSPDLVITDLMMPKMNGYKLIDALSRFPGTVPVIAMSGYDIDYHNINNNFLDENTLHLLQKPFSILEFSEIVHSALRRV